jgi:hypothetical protein
MQDLPPPSAYHLRYAVPSASIIKFPPIAVQSEKFKDLVCSDQDRSNIFEIITTIAENNKLTLLLKQSYLKNLGAQINHVHPLKFLATIFTSGRLKGCLYEIFDDYFKRGGFMDGLGSHLSQEADRGKIEPFLQDFAAEIKVPIEGMRPYFQKRDWEGLVRFLLKS